MHAVVVEGGWVCTGGVLWTAEVVNEGRGTMADLLRVGGEEVALVLLEVVEEK